MVGELIAERYELEELIAAGGMADVYRARDRLLDRIVAVKVLHDRHASDESFVARFRREAREAARLSHGNIVTVLDRGEENGMQFIVLEHVDGENLKSLLARRGPLPLRDAVEFAIQIGRGLHFAHTHGLVHRDVKPQNVLVGDSGEAKVTDFGIARAVADDAITQTGTVLGTSDYISPDAARSGDRQGDGEGSERPVPDDGRLRRGARGLPRRPRRRKRRRADGRRQAPPLPTSAEPATDAPGARPPARRRC